MGVRLAFIFFSAPQSKLYIFGRRRRRRRKLLTFRVWCDVGVLVVVRLTCPFLQDSVGVVARGAKALIL